jgi:3-oxoacyl-[acyl-carrier-protein] synthase-3
MAFFSNSNKYIKGIVTTSSSDKFTIEELGFQSGISENDIDKIKESTGVNQVFRSNYYTTSDYCVYAAKTLFDKVGWSPKDIDAVIFVTQTPDYILPKTSALIQKRLGLREDIFVLDINDGCSGFIYGLLTAYNFCSPDIKNVLLLLGETPSKQVNKNDKSANLLFGDGGGAIAITYDDSYALNTYFTQGVDGGGSDAIIIKDGGYRNVFCENSLVETDNGSGLIRSPMNLVMKGEDVFLFGITRVPKTIVEFREKYNIQDSEIDFFVMHQANLKMNQLIAKKLKIEQDKVLYSIDFFGNTSSLSIPLSIVHNKSKFTAKDSKVLCSGFGVGLSWGSTYLTLNSDIVLSHQFV